jgi:hypothetical protein
LEIQEARGGERYSALGKSGAGEVSGMRLYASAATLVCLCTFAFEAAAQMAASYAMGGQLERPPSPPVIVFDGILSPGIMITNPSILPRGRVARIFVEDYGSKFYQPSQPLVLSRTLTMDFDEHGRDVSEVNSEGSSESRTALSYQDGHILEIHTSFIYEGKPKGDPMHERWSYNTSGQITDFQRIRGNTIENHYTNFRYDSQGRLIGMDYRQKPGDKLQSRTEYKYAKDGKQLEEDRSEASGEQFQVQTRIIDDKGRIAEVFIKSRDWESKQWKPPVHVVFRYDTKGRLIEQATDPYTLGNDAAEQSIPVGKVSVVYDDAKHTRETSYTDGKERLGSVLQFDAAGATIGYSTTGYSLIGSGQTVKLSLDCKYDEQENWTECFQWVTRDGQRRMNERWKRVVTYR